MAKADKEETPQVPPKVEPTTDKAEAKKLPAYPGHERAEPGVEYLMPSGNTIMTPKVTQWLNS